MLIINFSAIYMKQFFFLNEIQNLEYIRKYIPKFARDKKIIQTHIS